MPARSPLRDRTYRTLWIAQLASAVGSWMQAVGAQWSLVHGPGAATWVSLVQAASLLPVLFVSLPAGVLADIIDRRRLLLGVQGAMTLLAAALAAMTATGRTTPALLVTLTFLLGCGQAVGNPAWQAIQPELVDREQIPAAAALGSLSVNVARAVGPALAGALLAFTSTWVLFAVNAASFTGVFFALLVWRRPSEEPHRAEALRPALFTAARYVRHAPGIRRILLRATLFVFPASALWALLPVVASGRLGLSAGGYGLLLGALGVGAVLGALAMGRLRGKLTSSQLLVTAGLVFACGMLGAALASNAAAVVVLMVPTGTGWLVTLSTLNTSMQLSLPDWVRARGLAVYLIVFLGGQGVGSLLWGVLAGAVGTVGVLSLTAGLLVLGTLTVPLLPLLPGTGSLDRTVAADWPEPALVFEPPRTAAPVLVEIEYRVPAENVEAYLRAAHRLGVSRRRTGAVRWGVFRDGADPQAFHEVFEVASWDEHLRQHRGRTTAFDQGLLDSVRAMCSREPVVRHLLPADQP